ncbi:MAG: hypothetical protein JNK02_17350 [Planctomycetes bacterium]|nr:hypothetical protein [Planctomycetota bacterium]
MSVFLVLALALPLQAPEPVTAWFPRLEAPHWAERERAERRLAALLEPEDAAVIRDALRAGGAETGLRLAQVLGAEDRLFGVAAELALDTDPRVARAAETGLRLALERFEPRAAGPALPRDELWAALAEHDGPALDARAPLSFEPAELADLLAIAAPEAPRIVLERATDADPAARRGLGVGLGVGLWREHARSLASRAGGRLVGFGLRREGGPHLVRWLFVAPRDVEEAQLFASELLERWCRTFAADGEPTARAAAARALVAHGLAPAVAWLERRARDARDDAALEGLLLAARRGSAVAALAEPALRAWSWDELERADGGDARGLHAALALARLGAPRGAEADAERARALAGLDLARPARAELVLAVLEGWVGPGGWAGADAAVRALLGHGACPHGVRLGALRVARRAGGPAPLVGDAEAFATAALRGGRGAEVLELLVGTPGWPSDAWAAREDLDLPAELEALLVAAWLARGAAEPATARLVRLFEARPAAAAPLGLALAGRADPALLRAAVQGAGPASAAELRLVAAGIGSEAERGRVLVALLGAPPSSGLEWAALAELCTGPGGELARARLASLLPSVDPELALRAATQAVRALRAALDGAGERQLLQAVRGAVRAERGGPHDRLFAPARWPPAADPLARALLDLDRSPARSPR